MWPLWGESRKAEREVESSAITFIFTPGRGKSIGNVSEVKDVGATSSRNLTLAPPQIEQYVARKGHASGKEELGRATWTFLHTLAAQYPVHPTRSQERDVKNMVRAVMGQSATILGYQASVLLYGRLPDLQMTFEFSSAVNQSVLQIDILTRMYPCKECADHFRLIVR